MSMAYYSVASDDFEVNTTTTPEVLKFLRHLLCANVYQYCYQEEIATSSISVRFNDGPFRDQILNQVAYYKLSPKLQGVKLGEVEHFSYSEIKELTRNFSEHQLIKKTHSGRLFRAQLMLNSKICEVAIKTWDFSIPCRSCHFHYPTKLVNELLMFSYGKLRPNPDTVLHPMEDVLRSNNNLAKVIGYSCDKILAVVYDLQSEQTVRDAIPTDTFDWKSRMKLALEMAQLVKSIHDCKHSIGSIDGDNIMIDKDGNFKLFVLGMHVLYGPKDESSIDPLSLYYAENYAASSSVIRSGCEVNLIKTDIYALGIVLLELITKQDHSLIDHGELKKGSLVDPSLKVNDDVGSQITELARSCVHWDQEKRPEISQIVTILENIYDLLHHPQKRQKMEMDGN